jgi:dipeptidyl-peptidase-3
MLKVLANKQPRKVFIQANTFLDESTGKVSLVEYEPSLEGMIKSYAERNI